MPHVGVDSYGDKFSHLFFSPRCIYNLVAFRGINGKIEAKAVECKAGRTWEAAGEALGQATAYQRLFPDVYVATRAGEEDLKHVESLLRELGLGYIQVEDGEAEEIFPSGHNIRFNRKEFELQVKGKAIALLACYDVLGRDKFQFGRADDPGYVWVSSLEPCNISCSVQEPGMIFWFALNIEKKGAINRMFSTVEVKELHKILSELPSDYRLWLGKFATYRPKKYEHEEERPASELKLQDVVSYTDKIRKWEWKAHVQVGKSVYFDVLSKTKFTSELRKAISELSPLQRLLNDLL